MKKIGINKKLYDRRLELDYSILEASIRLDISKFHLRLIEGGYIKVDEKLKKKFIRKYKLEENFFDNDENLGYPTLIEDESLEEYKPGKIFKAFTSLLNKIILLGLTIGFIAMFSTGIALTPKSINNTSSFFSPTIIEVKQIVKDRGIERSSIDSVPFTPYVSALLVDHYYQLYDNDPKIIDEDKYTLGLNFFVLDENLPYTFITGQGLVGSDSNYVNFEIRNLNESTIRVHFNYASDKSSYDGGDYAHISCDISLHDRSMKYNLVEDVNKLINYKHSYNEFDFLYSVYTYLFETYFDEFVSLVDPYMSTNFGITLHSYCVHLCDGIKALNSYTLMATRLVLYGIIFGIICLAAFILSIIFSYSIDKKIANKIETNDEKEINKLINNDNVTSNKKSLPKNSWPAPIIPEFILRIVVILVALTFSLTLYFIFKFAVDLNLAGLTYSIENFNVVSALFTLAMILIFFVNLDIKQNNKNMFSANFILFFAGLLYYVVMLTLSYTLGFSKSLISMSSKELLSILPGNILWGILSFNLLSTFLFTTPKFNEDRKWKIIVYRSCALLPLGYMIVSSIYSICSKLGVWDLPFAASNLLFSKGLTLTLFAVLYVFVVFIYKKITVKKYGLENALIYQTGNRYNFIKNSLVCLVIVALGLFNIIISKTIPDNVIGADKYWIILFLIPLILLYHPHRGKRNSKWDTSFIVLYGLSMVLGLILIVSSINMIISTM